LNQCSKLPPDLIVNICPLGCNGKCAEIWINETIGHRIICDCIKCGHNKKRYLNKEMKALGSVVGPVANAIHNIQSNSQGVI
jgi:hypothetical protein